jgi:hypothetical protein
LASQFEKNGDVLTRKIGGITAEQYVGVAKPYDVVNAMINYPLMYPEFNGYNPTAIIDGNRKRFAVYSEDAQILGYIPFEDVVAHGAPSQSKAKANQTAVHKAAYASRIKKARGAVLAREQILFGELPAGYGEGQRYNPKTLNRNIEDEVNQMTDEELLDRYDEIRAEGMESMKDPNLGAIEGQEIGETGMAISKFVSRLFGVNKEEDRKEAERAREYLAATKEEVIPAEEAAQEIRLAALPEKVQKIANVRNNNPGNIKATSDNWEGAVDTAKVGNIAEGQFVVFKSPEYGARALARDLDTKINRGLDTIAEILMVYAPPGKENNTAAYINTVAQRLRIDAQDKITKANRLELMRAIVEVEGGKDSLAYYTDDVLKTGIDWADRGV